VQDLIPNELRQTIERVHGEAGRQWLAILPDLLEEFTDRWSVTLQKPFENLSYNLVIPGHNASGAQVVLKLGPPCAELTAEATALRLFAGRGAVRLLNYDSARGALLIERIVPGIPLHQRQDEKTAIRTTAQLMRYLWREPPVEHSFPTLSRWFRALELLREQKPAKLFPMDLVDQAWADFVELQASEPRRVILHGDLHHENILYSTEHGWLAIDPKGLCGDPGYEVATFMLNQLPLNASRSTLRQVLARRVSIFSDELKMERQRLAKWSFCHAALSAAWSFEEGAEHKGTIFIAQVLEGLLI